MKRYGKLFDSGHWLDAQWWYPEADFLQLGESYDAQGITYNALAAELAATQDLLPFSAQELAARAKALEADRDQISLTLAVAKADRDKWFGRAKALEKEQWLIAECIFQNVSAGEMKHWAQGIKVSLSGADEVPRFTVERRGEMSGYTITLTDREYDALKDRIKALEAALWQLRERTKSPFLLDVIDKALASEPETTVKHPNCRNDLGICKWGCQKKCHLREMLDDVRVKLTPPVGTKGGAA